MDTSTESTAGCCADEHCNSGRRNRYFPRKQITADTYQVEQTFQQQRRHLLNRAIHGWGVVYGFALKLDGDSCGDAGEKHLEIGEGLALDACGRELIWVGTHCTEPLRVAIDDLLALDPSGKLIREPGGSCRSKDDPSPWDGANEKTCWLLRVHYAERLIAPVAIKDPCQCDQHEWDQVCETVRFSLQRIDCEKCCAKPCCGLHCDCTDSHCCPEHAAKPAERGGCRCLCDHLTKLDPNPACCSLAQVGKGLKVDLLQGVPLACVALGPDECGNWTIRAITDDCGPRRLVKRNDLLFDLIRGCDLARISSVSWHAAHRHDNAIPFAEFKELFGTPNGKGGNITLFSLKFSKPVQNATIRTDCFSITVIARDDGDGWGRTLRVPIVEVRKDDPHDAHHSLGATIVVDSDWARGALDDINVFGGRFFTRVEIKAHGDYLLDCNGLAVDANARGLCAAPTGNGTPGDDFISTFLVEPMKESDQETKSSYQGI